MSAWPAAKAKIVYRALIKIGWHPVRQTGSHIQLRNAACDYEYTWAFHDGTEIGPKMLARIAKQTGLKPSDL